MHIKHMIRRAYVGQSTPLAHEYYSKDYVWVEHAQKTAALVEAQWAAAPESVRQKAQICSTGAVLSAVAQFLKQLDQQHSQPGADGGSLVEEGTHYSSSDCSPGPNVAQQEALICKLETNAAGQHQQPLAVNRMHQVDSAAAVPDSTTSSTADSEWEVFYKAHPTAKFFKERRYLLLEFPCLAPPAPLRHVVEIGAGCGSSLLPILRAQPTATATACDISQTCLDQLNHAVSLLGLNPGRCRTFAADGTDAGLAATLAGCNADAALIMFTLSAVMPEGMLSMMCNAAAALRPGGLLCIRDHALYDMVQLRISAEQCIGRHLYRRGDATLAYFFTVEDLSALAVAAGLEVVECDYVCVVNRNRKTGQELRRAFVHGLFRRP